MRYREISKIIGYFLFCFSALIAVALIVGIYYDFFVEYAEHPFPDNARAFLITLIVSLSLASIFRLIGKRTSNLFHRRESILVVAIMWVVASLISALPFYITKTFDSPLNCWFESVSGLTTTGASVSYPKTYDPDGKEITYTYEDPRCPERTYQFHGTINRVWNAETKVWLTGFDAVSKPILFWRSLIQWVGGVGIIFVFIALFPALSIGGKFLFEAESIDPSPDTITPRVRETARYLWIIYLALTIALIILLMATNKNINFFHALITTFSTVSTGGFSIHSNSIAGYKSPTTEWLVILFMFLGAVNFSLFFHVVRRNFKRLLDPEFFFFVSSLLALVALTVWKLWGFGGHIIRNAFFQITSSMTCTGFFNTNYSVWPFACQGLMILAMYLGGMTGSTAGGIKSARHLILFRSFRERMERLFRPEAVRTLRIGQKEVTDQTLFNTFNFFWTCIIIASFGMLLLVLSDIDLVTSISVIAASVNNSGVGLRAVGPEGTFAILSPFARTVSIIWMLLGRLEFFAFLILFVPSFWRSR
jgi:trk system potassium uptake protein